MFNINLGPNMGMQNTGALGSSSGFGSGFQSQMLMSMMQMMMQMLSMFTGGGGMPMSGNFGNPYSGGNGLSNFLGAAPSGGGGGGYGAAPSYGAGNTAGVNPGMPGAQGTGQAAVDLARQYLGRDSISVKGQMPHFTAAGGVTNNCADFVSSALESQGLVKGHHINVKSFEQHLRQQGYRQIPASQAQPGDVWMNHSRGHTELVATPGARTLIGSNGSSRQKISEHNNNPDSGIYYTKR
ncbi:MAG: hypothetical protein WC314_15795 [Vulcanimicrobiota bacterium]